MTLVAVEAAPRGAGACFTAVVFLALPPAFAAGFTAVTVPFPEFMPAALFAAVLDVLTLFRPVGFVPALFWATVFFADFFAVVLVAACLGADLTAGFFAGFGAVFAVVLTGVAFFTALVAVCLVAVFFPAGFFAVTGFRVAVVFLPAVVVFPLVAFVEDVFFTDAFAAAFFGAVFFASAFFVTAFFAATLPVVFVAALFAVVFLAGAFFADAVDEAFLAAGLAAAFFTGLPRAGFFADPAVAAFLPEAEVFVAVVAFLAAGLAADFLAAADVVVLRVEVAFFVADALPAVVFFFFPVAILNNSLNISCSLQCPAPETRGTSTCRAGSSAGWAVRIRKAPEIHKPQTIPPAQGSCHHGDAGGHYR